MNSSRRLVSLVALALIVSVASAGAAHAGVNAFWKELNGSGSGFGVSQLMGSNSSASPWVAVGADGNPIVVYVQSGAFGTTGAIVLKRWNGTTFTTPGGPNGVGVGSEPQIRISSDGSTLYVAWLQDDGSGTQVHLLANALGSNTFTALGISNSPGGLTALNQSVFSFSLGVDANDNPIVAFDTLAQTGIPEPMPGILQDESQVYVKRYDPNTQTWEYLGSDPFTGGGASNAVSFSVDGGAAFARHSAFAPSVALQDDGGIIVAFQYATEYTGTVGTQSVANNSEIFVTRFGNASTWTALGPAVPQMDDGGAGQGGAGGISANTAISGPPSLASGAGQTWATWAEGVNIYARRFDGMAWVELNGSASGNGISNSAFPNVDPRVAIDTLGRPIVVWTNAVPDLEQTFVKRGEAGGFVEMGPNSASGDGISAAVLGSGSPMIATAPSGSAGPVAVWNAQDVTRTFPQVFLRQFSTATAFSLNVVLNGANGSTVTSFPPGISCPGDCSDTFPSGTLVQLTANAGPGQRLLNFAGCTSTSGNICNVSMTSNRTVNGSFVNTFPLTLTKQGTGALFATITAPAVGGGNAISCGTSSTNCSSIYNAGTTVALQIGTLPATTKFDGWGDDCAFRLKNLSCSLPINAAKAVSAFFTQTQFRLVLNPTTAAGPAATGARIDGINPDFDCFVGSGPCNTLVDAGTPVQLLAVPGPSQRLINITSTPANLCKANGSCAFTMSANNSTINASFRQVTQLLIQRIFGSSLSNSSANYVIFGGNGFASSSIDCGGGAKTRTGANHDCTGEAFTNSSVTMTAFLATGSTLDPNGGVCTWQGSGATRTCSFLANGLNQSVNVSYSQVKRLLTVTGANGTTQGFSTSNPPGIDCGNFGGHGDCTELYDHGQVVDLTPFPDTDSRFDRWVSGCSAIIQNANDSIRPLCRVNMTSNLTVVKNFVNARLLSLNASGNGAGAINTNLTPKFVYTHPGLAVSRLVSTNASVTLTPAPAVGSNFVWDDGLCTGSSPCTFKMSQNQSRVGLFRLNIHRLTVSRVGGNGSVVSTNDIGTDVINCGTSTTDCTTDQNFGTPINLQAAADVGFRFIKWTGTSPCSLGAQATNSSCSFQIKGNVTTIANYRAGTQIALLKTGNALNPNGQGTLTAMGTLGTGPTGAAATSLVTCGLTCGNTSFFGFDGKLVTFRATPSIGSNFVGFTGGGCPGGNSSTCAFVPSGSNQTVTGTFVLQQFLLSVGNSSSGVVTSTTPVGIINCGSGNNDCSETLNFSTPVTLLATPNPDFVFVKWTGDAVCNNKTTPSCSFPTMPNRNVTVTPTYRARTTINLLKAGNATNVAGQGVLTAAGTLGTGPNGVTATALVTCGLTCGNTSFAAFDGKLVTFKATTSVGSNFVGFSGDCTSNSSTCSYIPSGAVQNVTGTFVLQQFNLSVTRRLNGTVVSSQPMGAIDCGTLTTDCNEILNFSTPVSLAATADPGFVFVNWTGDAVCNGKTTATCSFPTMPNRNVTVTPNYRARTVVNVNKTGNGPGTVTSLPAGINCGADCSEAFFDGKPVKLTAVAIIGSNFTGFGGACVSNTSTCTFTPAGASQNVSANFVLQSFNLSVTRRLNGTVVSTQPMGAIDCGTGTTDCNEIVNFSAPVSLTATADPGFVFVNWTGDAVCNGTTTATCSFPTMPNRNVTVTPNYRARTVVGLIKTGGGQGTVTATNAGGAASQTPHPFTCGPTCTNGSFQAFDGRQVTLTAAPSTGSDFLGFSGDCVSNTSVCSFVPTGSSQNISANFVLESRTVNVTVNGDGVVMSGPFGCDAGTDPCAFTGDFGSTVIFTATPGAGNRVVSLTGCTSTTTGSNSSTCSVLLNQMSGNKSVTITFSFLMSVSKFGTGNGTVTGTGINCGADCFETYTPGVSVTLNRVPASGNNLGPWGDDCTFRGLNASCALTMNQNHVVSAGFFVPPVLTVQKLGLGNGSVTSSPVGINCGVDCVQGYTFGTVVTLTAAAASGSVFSGFPMGCDSTPTNTSCVVSMTANRTVVASFDAATNLSVKITFPSAMAVAVADEASAPSPLSPQTATLRAGGTVEDGFLRQVAVTVKRFWDWIWSGTGVASA